MKPRECECYYSIIKEKYEDIFVERAAYAKAVAALKAVADDPDLPVTTEGLRIVDQALRELGELE